METALLLAQTVTTGLITAWLCSGVRDNILHPSVNETYTAEVFNMTRMREDYPEAFSQVAHRAISSRRVQVFAFRLVVIVEALACIILLTGTVALALSLMGVVAVDTARAIAIYGTTSFVAIWASFLIVGNHFSYWFCHEAAQNTHYQMTLWGLATLILLAQG